MRFKHIITGALIMSLALVGAFSVSYYFFGARQIAKASTITLEVNNGVSCGGTGEPYCTINDALADIPANLVLAGDSYVIDVYSGSYPSVTVSGFTTDATHTLTIREKSGEDAIINFETSYLVHIDNVDHVTISGFEIYENSGSASSLLFIDNSNFVTINNTSLHGNVAFAMVTISNSQNTSLSSNEIYGVSGDALGIRVYGSCAGTEITNNSIYDHTKDGIEVYSATGPILITNNSINGNGLSGIYVMDSSNVSIEDNEIFQNSQIETRSGIFVSGTSSDTAILNNILHDELNNAINLSNVSTGNIVRYNTILNSKVGINLSSSPEFTIDHNLVYNNTMGIIASVTSTPPTSSIEYNTIYANICFGILVGSASNTDYPIIRNNIIANNARASGCNSAFPVLTDDGFGGLTIDNSSTSPYVNFTYNLFFNNGWSVDSGNEHVVEINLIDYSRGNYYDTATAINNINMIISEVQAENNFIGDPLLADPDGTDDDLTTWNDNNFIEGSGGAAIDSADPGDPFSNEPSPNGGRANVGRYGNTSQATTSSNNDSVDISATIDPYISFNLNTNICSLGGGTLTIGAISTCYYTATVGTNAVNGYIASIEGDADLTSGLDTIPATDGTITNGSSEYGIATSKSSVDVAQFSGTCDDPMTSPMTATAVSGTKQSISESSGPVADDETVVCHAAAVNVLTAAGTYTGLVTVSVLPNF